MLLKTNMNITNIFAKYHFNSIICCISALLWLNSSDNWTITGMSQDWEISCCFGWIPWPSMCAKEWAGNKPSWQRESLCMEAYVYRYRHKNRTGLDAWQCDLIKTEAGSEHTSNQYTSEEQGLSYSAKKRTYNHVIMGSSVNQHTSAHKHMTCTEVDLTLPVVRSQLLFPPFKGNLTN